MVLRTGDRPRVALNWLPADTEESVAGTEWHQEARGALAAMPRISAERQGDGWDACKDIEQQRVPAERMRLLRGDEPGKQRR